MAAAIEAALSRPEAALDYAELKLTFDALVAPFDAAAALAELDRLTAAARDLAQGSRDAPTLLAAIRTCLHKPGPWNDHRPFGYDRDDPAGQDPRGARLPDYLERGVWAIAWRCRCCC